MELQGSNLETKTKKEHVKNNQYSLKPGFTWGVLWPLRSCLLG